MIGHGLQGGLVGFATLPMVIDRAYATGSMQAIDGGAGGGLIGVLESGAVLDSFSTGAVTGFTNSSNGLVGATDNVYFGNDWYDQQSSGESACNDQGPDGSNGCNAVNTTDSPNPTYFFNSTTNPPYTGGISTWDFNSVWYSHPDTYPTLRAFGQAPVISNVVATPAQTSAKITWTTDTNADSSVSYGTTTNYGSSASDATQVTSHTVTINGLTCGTIYNYLITSVDAQSHAATSSNATFTTSACQGGLVASGGHASTAPVPSVSVPIQNTVTSTQQLPILFLVNLKPGSKSPDVARLQKFLNSHDAVIAASGTGSVGHETTQFGLLTKKALARFQKAHQLTPDGVFGTKTRAVVNAIVSKNQ